MKYKFRENDTDQTTLCNSQSILAGLNKNLLPDNLPKINYEQVEVYWQQKYGK